MFTAPTKQPCISRHGNAQRGPGTLKLLREVRRRETWHGSLRASLLVDFLMTRIIAKIICIAEKTKSYLVCHKKDNEISPCNRL